MKVLFFIDCFAAGGKERRLTELMKALKQRADIEFELAVMDREIYYKEIFDLGINIHYLIRKRKKDISIFVKLYRICKDVKPDVIHCWDGMTAVYSVPVCKLLHIKLVNGMVTDVPVKQNLGNKRWLRAKLTFPFSNTIIGNSVAGLEAYHAPKNKSISIYNGFNFNRLDKLDDPYSVRLKFNIKANYIILMIGAFTQRKDYESFVEAAKILCGRRDDIEFVAVGDGEKFKQISEKVGLSFGDKIKLIGKQTNVESIINASDVCVLMTNSIVHGEGISNSILEYMAMGKVVVASSGGGTNEIVEDQKTGFLVKPSNASELAEKIELLLNDLELRKSMGLAGRRRIEDHFSIDSMVNKFVSIYKNFNSVPVKKMDRVQA